MQDFIIMAATIMLIAGLGYFFIGFVEHKQNAEYWEHRYEKRSNDCNIYMERWNESKRELATLKQKIAKLHKESGE